MRLWRMMTVAVSLTVVFMAFGTGNAAASYLSKQEARSAIRYRERVLQRNNPFLVGFSIYDCARQSWSVFNCGETRYFNFGQDCDFRWVVYARDSSVHTQGSLIQCYAARIRGLTR